MNWTVPVDGYCERLAPGLLAEPVNLVTNAAFVIAALLIWRQARALPLARGLTVMLGLIGIGSALFHSFANRLTGLADVAPILAFILLYIFAASRDLLGYRPWVAALTVAGFFPFAALTVPVFQHLMPWLGSSAGYAPIPLLIAIYAVLVARKSPATAARLAAGAGLLILSIGFRTADLALCQSLPFGTHFLWHLTNAVLLAHMIALYCRHLLAARPPQG